MSQAGRASAFDTSYAFIHAPGRRFRIHDTLAVAASVHEIVEVPKLCIAQDRQACNLDVPILDEELARVAHGEIGR